MKILLIICIGICVSTSILYAQNKTINGRVVDDTLEPLPYVSIVINDTVKVGKTDLTGFFQIDIPISVKKILFESVGVEQGIIRLVDKCDEVELIMMLHGSYDFITLNKVNRLRVNKFKQLPALHKKAFDKGIFKTDKACYTQEFISY